MNSRGRGVMSSPRCAGLPAKLNPEWCRFRTGGVCLVGEVRAEADGVPPRDMGENSDTGPSYIPLGTGLRTASLCGGWMERRRERE